MLRTWLNQLRKQPSGGKPRSEYVNRRPRSTRLELEHLEDRTVPSTFLVYNLSDSGPGSLRAAVNAANVSPGSTIDFYPGLHGTIYLNSGQPLDIGSNMTINGPGSAYLDISAVKSNQRIFQVNGGVTASLSGLTIENADLFGLDGGGVFNSGTLTLTGCELYNDWAYDGGGIYNNYSGTLHVNDTIFESNNAAYVGGAIFNVGTLDINSNSYIGFNNANLWGGAIYNGGDITGIDNSTVTNNRAVYGGGIFNNASLTVNNSTIGSNTAESNPLFEGGYGGGIYNQGTATLNGANVSSNSATLDGGGIGNTGTLTVTNNSYISYNWTWGSGTTGEGGGIFNESSGHVFVDHSWVTWNHAPNNDGGGIWNTGTLILQNYAVVEDNFAYAGGGIDNGGTVIVNGINDQGVYSESSVCYVESNQATWNGGGINNGGTVNLANAAVESNIAGNYGGGIMNDAGATLNVYYPEHIYQTEFYNNTAQIGGGIFNGGGTVNYPPNSIYFSDNHAAWGPNFFSEFPEFWF